MPPRPLGIDTNLDINNSFPSPGPLPPSHPRSLNEGLNNIHVDINFNSLSFNDIINVWTTSTSLQSHLMLSAYSQWICYRGRVFIISRADLNRNHLMTIYT